MIRKIKEDRREMGVQVKIIEVDEINWKIEFVIFST